MREIPCSGTVIKASDLTPHLPEYVREEYRQLCEASDWESVSTILADHMPEGFPRFSDVFALNSEATPGDDLEESVVYVCYDDSELYTRIETPALKALKEVGIVPITTQWSVFG